MLGQVRFAPIPAIAETATVNRLQETLRDDWPEFDGEQVVQIPWGPPGAQELVPTRSFRFSTADRTWGFVLTPGSLTLEATAAVPKRSYREFAERFAHAWGALSETVSEPRLIHQGLRYTNVLDHGDPAPEDWSQLINGQLLGPLSDANFAADVIESLSEFRLKRPPEATVVLKHGIARGEQAGTPSYVLDLDHFAQHLPKSLTPGAVCSRFDQFDESLGALFRWCVIDDTVVAPA